MRLNGWDSAWPWLLQFFPTASQNRLESLWNGKETWRPVVRFSALFMLREYVQRLHGSTCWVFSFISLLWLFIFSPCLVPGREDFFNRGNHWTQLLTHTLPRCLAKHRAETKASLCPPHFFLFWTRWRCTDSFCGSRPHSFLLRTGLPHKERVIITESRGKCFRGFRALGRSRRDVLKLPFILLFGCGYARKPPELALHCSLLLLGN